MGARAVNIPWLLPSEMGAGGEQGGGGGEGREEDKEKDQDQGEGGGQPGTSLTHFAFGKGKEQEKCVLLERCDLDQFNMKSAWKSEIN